MKTLIFLTMLLITTIIGGVMAEKSERFGLAGFLVMLASGSLLVLCLVFIPIIRHDYKVEMASYEAFVQTVGESRVEEMSELERANLTVKIAEWNEFIAGAKYKNSTIFDWFVPDEIMEINSIK